VLKNIETLYALKTLRVHEMSDSTLHTVFKFMSEAKLTYAAPAWYGFCSSLDREGLKSFPRKSIRFGFRPPSSPLFADICVSADIKLFKAIQINRDHVLYLLLTKKKLISYNIRKRPHDFVLPNRTSHIADSNFFIRVLYNY